MSDNRETKCQPIRINCIDSPTMDWDEFGYIFEILQKETVLASNKIISVCNVYSALGKDNEWLKSTYGSDKIRNVLYAVARGNCEFQYSGAANMISNNIYKNYFTGKNSWEKKIQKGDGNPPMSFEEDIPLFIRNDRNAKPICINEERGYYELSFSFLNNNAKGNMFYESKKDDKNGKEKTEKKVIETNSNKLKFRFGVKKNAQLEELIKKLEDPDSGYKIGDSQLKRWKNKKTKRWIYSLQLAYSFPKDDTIKKTLDPEKIMGVDVGIKVPLYATINTDTKLKFKLGDDRIHKKALKDIRERSKIQRVVSFNLRDGHGRKHKLDIIRAKKKTRNRQKTYNNVLSRRLVNLAIKRRCGTIHIEDLSGMKQREKDNLFLQTWNYFELQQMIIQKANEVGITVAKVKRYGTSQTCPCCGFKDAKNRPKGKYGQAYFKCIECGYHDNADHVAAINISRAEPIKNMIYPGWVEEV